MEQIIESTWSGIVMTHPSRAHQQNWFHGWPRMVDPGIGLTRNFCEAMRSAATAGETWSVVAQDDVEPCRGLVSNLGRILGEVPFGFGVVSFFSIGRVRDWNDIRSGVRWRAHRRGELLWILLLAVRTEIAHAVANGVEMQRRPADANGCRHTTTGCDERLSLWLDANGVMSATHLPSLVQHRGERSLAGHGWTIGGRARVSPTYSYNTLEALYGEWQ